MTHSAILGIVSAVWVGAEVILAILTHGTARKDRSSYAALNLLIGGGILAAAMVSKYLRMPSGTFWPGMALIAIGIAIRATAILTLRRYFTVQVTIQDSHELIERGLYRFIRHPAYTGALLSFLGLGLAFGSWLSLAIIVAASLIGFAYRIRVEEQALAGHFGDRYRAYAARTKRIIPGIY
jgi:protein-S-isoprenylcysteine O-methyltransferase